MRRLVCACVVRKSPKAFFLAARPLYVPEDLLNLFLTNSADPDEMSPYVAFHLGLSTCTSILNDKGYMINHTTHLVVDELALGHGLPAMLPPFHWTAIPLCSWRSQIFSKIIPNRRVISGSHQRRMPRFKSASKAPSFLFTFPKISRSPK